MALTRIGVRARVQWSFAAGGLLVSAFVAAVSWSLTTTYLYNQREITATRNALVSADLLSRRLADDRSLTAEQLQETTSAGSRAVYLPAGRRDRTVATPGVRADQLPAALVELAASGTAAQQRVLVDDRPLLAVAVPVSVGVYVELVSLNVLDATLRGLSRVLAATAALAVLLAAALGRWAARRTLRPLLTLVEAAQQVAGGALDTRVDGADDPDLRPLAEAFNRTTGALRERVARDARFASDVSHELRSPVTTMVNAAELLQNRRHELSPSAQQAFDLLDTEVQRFRLLVEDLLEVSRADPQAAPHLDVVRLGPLVRRVADRRSGRPVTRVEADAEQALVEAEPRRLERVIGNLVDNAELHGGGVRDVAVSRADAGVRITVRDEGDGVPPEDRAAVFERFFRGSRSRAEVPGSGLGLAIAAQHVRAHGGRIWVEDAVPRGAAFVVELPLARGPS